MPIISLARLFLLFVLVPAVGLAQDPPDAGAPRAGPGDLALAPSRFELPLAPGASQTVVVNVISSPGSPGAKPFRLLASLGDWTLTRDGQVTFAQPGSTPRSAADWMIYSPVELSVAPGETHSIRVTIDVPPDAKPGDYTSVLFVEERPPDLKTQENTKRITFHFRLAAIFYVIVPPVELKGALTALKAEVGRDGVVVSPVLSNQGNSRLRPSQTVELSDATGNIVFTSTTSASIPVLAQSEYEPTMTISPLPAPGEYTLKYRVDFLDGGKVIEGRKTVVIPAAPPPPPEKKPAESPTGSSRSKPVPKKRK